MSIVTKEIYENQRVQSKARMIIDEITENLIQAGIKINGYVSAIGYLLFRASQYNNPFGVSLKVLSEELQNEGKKLAILNSTGFTEVVWEKLQTLLSKYTSEEFAMAAILPVFELDPRGAASSTPESIIKLTHKLLEVRPGENVADIGCGTGSYLVSAAVNEPKAHYYGFELNEDMASLAMLRSELLDADMRIISGDVFEVDTEDLSPKFDKVFANYPFGLKLRHLDVGTGILQHMMTTYPGLSKATSADWIFNVLVCKFLSETGRAVGIMTNGSTWNGSDAPMRKYFIDHHLIECVISLPGKMFGFTNIPTTLVVFSHDNSHVRMVDATELCQQGRRQNEFSAEDIEHIMNALKADSMISKLISTEELQNNEYVLNLSRYIENNVDHDTGVPFESVISSITRGAQCTASQLDEMVSDVETDTQYLMLGNIQNGIIDNKLPYLRAIDSKYDKYCLKTGNIILSKNSYPFKVAVAEVADGRKILANGNLYIISVNEEKANPYYIKAFLDSEQGQTILKGISVGASLPNIGVDKLKKIMIPLPTLEEQNHIAQKYLDALNDLTQIKAQLEAAEYRLRHIFDET